MKSAWASWPPSLTARLSHIRPSISCGRYSSMKRTFMPGAEGATSWVRCPETNHLADGKTPRHRKRLPAYRRGRGPGPLPFAHAFYEPMPPGGPGPTAGSRVGRLGSLEGVVRGPNGRSRTHPPPPALRTDKRCSQLPTHEPGSRRSVTG